jgi:polyhydroxyalkanoate synthesis regulator phasin
LNYAEAKLRLENSTAFSLLRALNAPLCLGFLSAVFRVDRAVWRAQSEMVARLTTVVEEINEAERAPRFKENAKYYLDQWVKDGALLTRYDENNEIVYELTPEADQALLILDRLGDRAQNTAGAESKLRAITATLQQIAERANPDRDQRIRSLQEKIDELREQIDRLRAGEPLIADKPEQLIERYQFAVDIARQLLADFSLIRQRFLNLAKELAEQHASAEATRGTILARALDVHRELNEGPLGHSFAAFQEFLHSPESQKTMFALIDQITRLEGIGLEEMRTKFLSKLPAGLLAEAKSVVIQTRRLSAELRQMLDSDAITTRRQVMESLAAARALAYRLSDEPPSVHLLSMSRPYAELYRAELVLRLPWRAPEQVTGLADSSAHETSAEEKERMRALMAQLPAIEIARLQGHIAHKFAAGDNAFRLLEMLEWFPPAEGQWLLDVVGYLEIARQKGSKHTISDDEAHTWLYQPSGESAGYRLPQIYFYR